MESNWASLPKDILCSVHEKLFPRVEYTRFAVVCKPWLGVAVENCERLKRHGVLDQIPVLVTPTEREQNIRQSLYSILGHKVCEIQLPQELANGQIFGTSRGWIATVDVYGYRMTLYNPIRNKIINLPPCVKENFLWWSGVGKFVISERFASSVIDEDNFIVAVSIGSFVAPTCYYKRVGAYAPATRLAYTRSGDVSWTYCDSSLRFICDVFFYKGVLHVMDRGASVSTIDVHKLDSPPEFKTVVPSTWTMDYEGHEHYIAESPTTGDLLLFIRYYKNNDPRLTVKFKVFTMMGSHGWVDTTSSSLVGVAAFVDNFEIRCFISPQQLGCCWVPNHIYYTNNIIDGYNFVGIYRIEEDGSSSQHSTVARCHGLRSFWMPLPLPKLDFEENSLIKSSLRCDNRPSSSAEKGSVKRRNLETTDTKSVETKDDELLLSEITFNDLLWSRPHCSSTRVFIYL